MRRVTAVTQEIERFYVRHVRVLLIGGPLVSGGMIVGARVLSHYARLGSPIPNVNPHIGVFAAALVAYLLLALGALNAGLLFALSRPWPAAAGVATGTIASIAVDATLIPVLQLSPV